MCVPSFAKLYQNPISIVFSYCAETHGRHQKQYTASIAASVKELCSAAWNGDLYVDLQTMTPHKFTASMHRSYLNKMLLTWKRRVVVSITGIFGNFLTSRGTGILHSWNGNSRWPCLFCLVLMKCFFTARRYASAVLTVIVCLSVRLSVCLSVCLSDTSRSCTKMAKPRIRLTTPYDSPETLVLRCQKSWRNSHDITPNGGAK